MAVKILFFIENLTGGGAERVLCNLVNAMDQSRFDITVQTLWKADASRHLNPGIRYQYCFASKTKGSQIQSRIEAAMGLTYPLHIKDDYDIEAAYLEFGSTKILSRSTNRRAKKIAWVHSDLARKLNGQEELLRKTARQYAAYDKIVCVSQTARDSFVSLFGRRQDTVVLYNTLDDADIRSRAELVPSDFPKKRRLTVVAAGRLAEEKQYDMLLRIHKRLWEEGLEHDLWIVGEGGERGTLEAYMTENQLGDSAKLLGFQANPYPYMKAADLLVCSSRYEGMSTFVAEGLILGKPIVTTECSGMRELLGDSECGLITENSEASLAAGLRRLLTDSDLRERYAAKAGKRGQDFSARRQAGRTEEFFLNMLEDGTR